MYIWWNNSNFYPMQYSRDTFYCSCPDFQTGSIEQQKPSFSFAWLGFLWRRPMFDDGSDPKHWRMPLLLPNLSLGLIKFSDGMPGVSISVSLPTCSTLSFTSTLSCFCVSGRHHSFRLLCLFVFIWLKCKMWKMAASCGRLLRILNFYVGHLKWHKAPRSPRTGVFFPSMASEAAQTVTRERPSGARRSSKDEER